MSSVGITGYGAYVPMYRVKVEEIAKVWGRDGESVRDGLFLHEKSVPAMDEDTATISIHAAKNALKHAGLKGGDIGAVYVGSESHPYAVKPTAVTVAEAIGSTPNVMAADYEFACKAGTAAIQNCMGLVKAGYIEHGMAIGADTSQGRPGDVLEYSASAGGGAFVIGKKELIAEITHTVSFTSDTPDFWRREGEQYPRHGARFTGEPAYFKHVVNCTKNLFKASGLNAGDFDYAVFHQPNGKFPLKAAKELGFPKEKVMTGLLTPWIGNTYSGASMVGLAAVLDVAKPGQKIMVTSFGSGAGSDSFALEVKDAIDSKRGNVTPVKKYVDRKKYLSYGE
ncbi:MAG TPA: hydroxymethylglutaryl-CoA synthase, partial [archaeon]|nr:hydroxymethylglutaryl-CoA synthase [archaeon]